MEARKATSAGAHAEEVTGARRTARLAREETRRRDDAIRAAEKNADALEREVAQLRSALDKETRARELAERDAGTANDQLREKRVEIARLRDSVVTPTLPNSNSRDLKARKTPRTPASKLSDSRSRDATPRRR
jgi:chromosome segregation ATPase